jgi:hypothetical protein
VFDEQAKKPDKKKRNPIETVSFETEAEQLEILTEFYDEINEEKTQDDIQAILDKRKDEGADVLTKDQFMELWCVRAPLFAEEISSFVFLLPSCASSSWRD